jgi:hypothetical protein
MQQYIIWWQPTKETDLVNEFPELDTTNATYEEPTVAWEDGYNWVEQDLTPEQFVIVDNAANQLIAIDVKPSPHPPYSPTGR